MRAQRDRIEHRRDRSSNNKRALAAPRTVTVYLLLAAMQCLINRSWTCALEDAFAPLIIAENRSALVRQPKSTTAPRPLLLVSIATVPGIRESRMVGEAVQSLLRGSHVPERIVIVAPRFFTRFSNRVNFTRLRGQFLGNLQRVEMRYCAQDYGPGTKLLCALPVLRRLATAPNIWSLVVADDDKYYKPWALEGLVATIAQAPSTRFAFSYLVNDLWLRGKLNPTLMARAVRRRPDLRMGQGADLMAIPAGALLHQPVLMHDAADRLRKRENSPGGLRRGLAGSDTDGGDDERSSGIHAFFACALRVEPHYRWHDDMWISSFLLLQNVSMVQVPVQWPNPIPSTHSAWVKSPYTSSRKYQQSTLVDINQTVDAPGHAGIERELIILTHKRINAATHRAFGRLVETCRHTVSRESHT